MKLYRQRPRAVLDGPTLLCWLLLLMLLMLLAACGGRSEAVASDLTIRLTPALEGPAGAYLTVQLSDAAGAPVTDATVQLEGNMNHAGMAPVLTTSVADDADGAVDGSYRVPFAFTMLGDWIISVSVARPGQEPVTQNIKVGVTAEQVEVTGP